MWAKRVKEDFEIAADPCEVLLYENFNYKISFHTEENGEWKKVEVGQIFHDDTVQYPSLTVGQIDHFPEKDCSDVNKVKMRLEPLMPLEPFGPEHPHKVKFLFNEGVNFTQRIKPCKFARNMFSKGVFAILFFLVAISAIFLHSGTEWLIDSLGQLQCFLHTPTWFATFGFVTVLHFNKKLFPKTVILACAVHCPLSLIIARSQLLACIAILLC